VQAVVAAVAIRKRRRSSIFMGRRIGGWGIYGKWRGVGRGDA